VNQIVANARPGYPLKTATTVVNAQALPESQQSAEPAAQVEPVSAVQKPAAAPVGEKKANDAANPASKKVTQTAPAKVAEATAPVR
jgi:hypothetical protein